MLLRKPARPRAGGREPLRVNFSIRVGVVGAPVAKSRLQRLVGDADARRHVPERSRLWLQ